MSDDIKIRLIPLLLHFFQIPKIASFTMAFALSLSLYLSKVWQTNINERQKYIYNIYIYHNCLQCPERSRLVLRFCVKGTEVPFRRLLSGLFLDPVGTGARNRGTIPSSPFPSLVSRIFFFSKKEKKKKDRAVCHLGANLNRYKFQAHDYGLFLLTVHRVSARYVAKCFWVAWIPSDREAERGTWPFRGGEAIPWP